MKDGHITDMLDGAALARLTEDELRAINTHTAACAECARAYEAARIAALLLRERAAEAVEPSPFFQTRVLAALRERQAAGAEWSLGRLWRAAGLLVSSMTATVAALAVLTFVAPSQSQQVAVTGDWYTAEELLFEPGDQSVNQLTDSQVLTTLYDAEEDAAR